MITSVPFNEGERKKPHKDGIFYKSAVPQHMTDAFKRMPNSEISKMKTAHIRAKNLGPGVPQLSIDAFRLLKQDP